MEREVYEFRSNSGGGWDYVVRRVEHDGKTFIELTGSYVLENIRIYGRDYHMRIGTLVLHTARPHASLYPTNPSGNMGSYKASTKALYLYLDAFREVFPKEAYSP